MNFNKLLIYVRVPLNNTGVSLTDFRGRILTYKTSGTCGFKGSQKVTPFAAQIVIDSFLLKAEKYLKKCQEIHIFFSGFGPGREIVLKTLQKMKKVYVIRDITSLPHNGCRPPKKRRL